MGWLWSSPKDTPTSTEAPTNLNNPPPSTQPPPPPESTPPPDPELEAFLTSLRPSNSQRPSRPIPGFPTPNPTQSPLHPNHPSISPSTDLITPTNLHPTTISCRSAFDTAFYCASLGGQFTNIYRYGSLRRCSDEWAEFWWCVRTSRGFMSDEEREAMVLRRARERESRLYRGNGVSGPERGGSSEDVWEARRRVVRGAFQGDYWAAVEENERLEREGSGRIVDGAVGREV